MKLETYKKAEAIQLKIHQLELAKADIENGGVPAISVYDPDVGGSFNLDEEVMKKISSSALAIINLELRELKNEFMML